MTTINKQNFDNLLESFTKTAKSQRDQLQQFILFGLVQYEQHGDTVYLSKVQAACADIKSFPSKTIQAYIMEHANVFLTKGYIYKKKVNKDGTKQPVEVTMPIKVWYEHPLNKNNQADFNLGKYGDSVGKKIAREGVSFDEFMAAARAGYNEAMKKNGPVKSIKAEKAA